MQGNHFIKTLIRERATSDFQSLSYSFPEETGHSDILQIYKLSIIKLNQLSYTKGINGCFP
ncbi:hypothetical protein BACCOP_03631 [Phocaeicola coprocola DSM 17136]|jgi:hypothetical protein|uniref:Uncharacterized protein n=1 Tax=Phocaeicola coprocola DSM 17136 TaxID=470145 RepID=B3JNW5_9BACT|nr:hypothetical protein BACCOP_03631 [Phocaeicola coprocola DSM 17136]